MALQGLVPSLVLECIRILVSRSQDLLQVVPFFCTTKDRHSYRESLDVWSVGQCMSDPSDTRCSRVILDLDTLCPCIHLDMSVENSHIVDTHLFISLLANTSALVLTS
jgi:hypothetical protein